ncbi:hypothetical protein QQ045_013631 [Rhodiola kirilowii]
MAREQGAGGTKVAAIVTKGSRTETEVRQRGGSGDKDVTPKGSGRLCERRQGKRPEVGPPGNDGGGEHVKPIADDCLLQWKGKAMRNSVRTTVGTYFDVEKSAADSMVLVSVGPYDADGDITTVVMSDIGDGKGEQTEGKPQRGCPVVGLIETKMRTVGWDTMKLKLGFQNCFVVGREGLSSGMSVLWNNESELEIFNLPWVVMGDFNEVVSLKEVWGRGGRPNWQMANFRQALEECHLADLGYVGSPFTYSNRRKGNDEMRGRLDRAVGNSEWMQAHPKGQVHHLNIHVSDHCIIMLVIDSDGEWKRRRPFRFAAMWMDNPEFSDVMIYIWEAGRGCSGSWSERLDVCKEKLKAWNSSTFGNVQRRVKSIKDRLEEIKALVRTEAVIEEEGRLSVDQWLLREEVLWLQRSRISWLKFGDRNTKFFHACANQRRKKNWIKELRDARGNRFSDRNKITSMAAEYFDDIFSPSYATSEVDWNQQLECLQPTITEEVNQFLLEDISEEEVRRAVFNMSPLKAPGMDGFPALFYQKNWGSIRGFVVDFVRDFWINGELDDRINKTLIVLIPNQKDADRMEDLRPISLCNVAVKIITKILDARLKGILDKVISVSQSSFIKGRITDNFIVAHEISHFLKRCRSQKEFFASIKVDMSKAYDRVEWPFLEQSYVMRPICDISELLSAKISSVVARNSLSGIKFGREGPIISHLFFADDSIFFIKATKEEATVFREVLSQYEMVSGQRINMKKLEVVFSCKTPADRRKYIGNLLRIEQKDGDLQLHYGKDLEEGKILSMAGKEVLIKAVVQSIPVYMMSVYYFPQKNLDNIAKLIGQYWWNKTGRKGISWVSREVLQQKKEGGGLGFKDLRVFNEAILMKICWHILTQPQLLVSQVLRVVLDRPGME